MSITRATLRQMLSEELEDWFSIAATSAGDASGTTVVSTTLKNYVGFDFKDWYYLLTSGTYIGTWRVIQRFEPASGYLEVYNAYGGQVASAVTGEIHRYNPDLLHSALNDALRDVYPRLRIDYVDETLVGCNFLPNSHFENWATTTYPDFWRVQGTGVVSVEDTSTIRGGVKSAKVTRAGTDGSLYISSAQYPDLLQLQGQSITVYGQVNSSVASQARLQIYSIQSDGTTSTSSSDYHTGGGKYELLSVDGAVLSDATEVQIRCAVGTSNTVCYFDDVYTEGVQPTKYYVPTQMEAVHRICQITGDVDDIGEGSEIECPDWDTARDSSERLIIITNDAWTNRLRIYGSGRLSTLSTDTSTVEIDQAEARYVAAMATEILIDRLRQNVNAETLASYDRLLSRRAANSRILRGKYGKPYIPVRTRRNW